MGQYAADVKDFSSSRDLIQKALECLDELGLPMAAAYVDMAKTIFEKHISIMVSNGITGSPYVEPDHPITTMPKNSRLATSR